MTGLEVLEALPSEWDAELRSGPGAPVSPRVLFFFFSSTGVQVLRFWTGSNLSNYILSPSVPPAASGGYRILIHFLHYMWERYHAAVKQLPQSSPYTVSKALLDERHYINIFYCHVLVAFPLCRFCEKLTIKSRSIFYSTLTFNFFPYLLFSPL